MKEKENRAGANGEFSERLSHVASTMTNSLEDEINRTVERMDNQENQEPDANTGTPSDSIQDIYVLIVREGIEAPDNIQVVDSTTVTPQKPSMLPAFLAMSAYLFLILSTILFQVWALFNPTTATITIIPKSQTVTLSGTLQLGRLLNPITISQSQTTATTGKGHQDAKAATGQITLYNGEFQSVFIAAGTILTGTSGVQIITDQDTTIPPGNPPNYGQVTISAHAINSGVRGNIAAYDMNQACCATSVLAKNTQPFYGGQNERDFSTVSQHDINKISTLLKSSLSQSLAGAFQGQLKPNEQLTALPCTRTVSSDHQPGQEAALVKVTVSQTCSAVAYNSQTPAEKAVAFLSTQALQKPGTGYSLVGQIQVSVKDATITHTTTPLVLLSYSASGTWVYALSQKAQQQIKHLIAGKSRQEARELLASLPGIERASISFNGFGDEIRLPKTTGNIHLILIVV